MSDPDPLRIGRFLIEEMVGSGGFSRVYRADDPKLHRTVALKVFDREVVELLGAARISLSEARTLAGLDHPGIVRVHDVQEDDENGTYIVSEFIEGCSLAEVAKREGISEFSRVADLIRKIAEALHAAHERGRVHRDLKPGNIMIGPGGDPVIVDFGVALLHERCGPDWGKLIGTPPYVSPEQVRGEGHRIDGRSDVFSLSVILYELLTRQIPFDGNSREILASVEDLDVIPLRQINDSIPRELERICLQGLEKRPSNRFASAAEMAEALGDFLRRDEHEPAGDRQLAVVPRGLTSFDEGDAGFFLRLLPGPRDSEGLPESVRVWKSRIESVDPAQTFRIGLLYGPSGCGKSSLARAGILPQLDPSVTPIVAGADETPTTQRILSAIHHRYPRLDGERDLRTLLQSVREGRGGPTVGSKLLLVIDQFEQHLHYNSRAGDSGELLLALRQCDGVRLQAILIVRSEFWVGVSHFFQELEIDINTGRNATAVDLFDPRHSRAVLADFGRAYRCLPEDEEPSRGHNQFLDRAVDQLSEDGSVFPVRLALFAQMFASKQWIPAALREAGGADGIGIQFLNESFGEDASDLTVKKHRDAATRLLAAMLPESTASIKGDRRSRSELAVAAGHEPDAEEFSELLTILQERLRLLTAIDAGSEAEYEEPHFQLTHDYLIPSIRGWLERVKEQTARGRAELKLQHLTDSWTPTENRKLLPGVFEWARIRLRTNSRIWSHHQSRMMSAASHRAAVRVAVVSAILLLFAFAGYEVHGRYKAQQKIRELARVELSQLAPTVESMEPYLRWVNPELHKILVDKDSSENLKLRASAALAHFDPGQARILIGELLSSWSGETFDLEPGDFHGIFETIAGSVGGSKPEIEAALDNGEEPDQRMKAEAMLFLHDPSSRETWFSDSLLELDPAELGPWIKVLSTRRSEIRSQLQAAMAKSPEMAVAEDTRLTNEEAEAIDAAAKRQSLAAIGLAFLEDQQGWSLLKHHPVPTARSFMITYLPKAKFPLMKLVAALTEVDDEGQMMGLLQAIGGYEPSKHTLEDSQLVENALRSQVESPRAGINSSAHYALAAWGITGIDDNPGRERRFGEVDEPGEWFDGPLGMRFVVLPEFENGRRVAIAMHEVTVSQYLKLNHGYNPPSTDLIEDRNAPAGWVHFRDWLTFLNSLTKKGGGEYCYSDEKDAVALEGHLEIGGFRLPTFSEWMNAAQAGTTSKSGYFGETSARDVVDHYEVHRLNNIGKLHPVGQKRPNPFGLFDVLANAKELTHNGGNPWERRSNPVRVGNNTEISPASLNFKRESPSPPHYYVDTTIRVTVTLKPSRETPPKKTGNKQN